jgi:hypothetical protein
MWIGARPEKFFSLGLIGLAPPCPPDKEIIFESRNDFQETDKIPMLGKLMS